MTTPFTRDCVKAPDDIEAEDIVSHLSQSAAAWYAGLDRTDQRRLVAYRRAVKARFFSDAWVAYPGIVKAETGQ